MLAKLLPDGDYTITPACERCYFGRKISNFYVECHANPPTVSPSALETHEGNCTFPILGVGNFCGHFQIERGPFHE